MIKCCTCLGSTKRWMKTLPRSNYIKLALTLIAALLAAGIHAQVYQRPNEELIFQFQTQKGKLAYLVKDRANRYIMYRYGTPGKIELEYPSSTAGSWKQFTYSYWFRGGGIRNEGIDLNYVTFVNGNFTYVLFHTYFARGERLSAGIRVIETKTGRKTILRAIPKTVKGTLVNFRDNDLIGQGETLYD